MPEHVKIELIRISIGNKVIEITPEEARKLYAELHSLVGPHPAEPIYIPHYIPTTHPAPFWEQPIYCNPNQEPFPDRWCVVCSAYDASRNTLNINI